MTNIKKTDNGVELVLNGKTERFVKEEIAYDWRDKYNELNKKHLELIVRLNTGRIEIIEILKGI